MFVSSEHVFVRLQSGAYYLLVFNPRFTLESSSLMPGLQLHGINTIAEKKNHKLWHSFAKSSTQKRRSGHEAYNSLNTLRKYSKTKLIRIFMTLLNYHNLNKNDKSDLFLGGYCHTFNRNFGAVRS